MRERVSTVPRIRREAKYAVALFAALVSLGLLFVFPAPKPYIEAQIELRGLNKGSGVSVTASEERGVSLDWTSEREALLTITAPRDALITLSTGQDVITFTIHNLIMYTEQQWAVGQGQVSAEILAGKVVDWDPSLTQQAYAALYDNRFVLALLAVFSVAFVYARSRPRYRPLSPLLIVGSFLAYQVLFFLDLTPTLYWDTPLTDPFVRACLVTQMILSLALIALWFPLRRLVGRARPGALEGMDGFIDRYGLLLLVSLPIIQHVIGHGVFGYNLQPTDARYTYMDWGRAMLQRGVLPFLSKGLLRRMETPLIGAAWAFFYRITGSGYVASAVVPMLYFEMVIVCTYQLAKELFDRRLAFYAGLFLALSPLFSFASYFVMSDVPSAAMTVLTLWLFVLALKRESVPLALVSGLCLFLTTVTKLTGVYCAFLVLLVYIFSAARKKRILLATLAFVVLLPLAYVAPYFLQHGLSAEAVQAGQEHLKAWAKRPMYQDREDEPVDWNDMVLKSGQIHYYMGPSSKLFYFRYLVNGVGFPIVFWGVLILVIWAKSRVGGEEIRWLSLGVSPRWLVALGIWILPLLLFVSLWSMRNTRFSYIAFPAYAMLGACGFALYRRQNRFDQVRHSGLVLGLSVIMLSTQSAANYYNVSYLKNADYRDPIFIESSEPYYYIHRHYSGWHVGWNGAGTDHHFTGSIVTDGQFERVEPFELEAYPDVLEVTGDGSTIQFDTMSRSGEDGCSFTIEGGTFVTFDMLTDGVSYPDRTYIYEGSIGLEREAASSLPLTLPLD